MERFNYCRRVFSMIFSVLMTAYFLTLGLVVIVGPDKKAIDNFMNSQNPLIILLVMVVFLIFFGYFGVKIYDNYLGTRLRKRGWNETSFLSGLSLGLLTILVLDALPVLVIALTSIIIS